MAKVAVHCLLKLIVPSSPHATPAGLRYSGLSTVRQKSSSLGFEAELENFDLQDRLGAKDRS